MLPYRGGGKERRSSSSPSFHPAVTFQGGLPHPASPRRKERKKKRRKETLSTKKRIRTECKKEEMGSGVFLSAGERREKGEFVHFSFTPTAQKRILQSSGEKRKKKGGKKKEGSGVRVLVRVLREMKEKRPLGLALSRRRKGGAFFRLRC